MQQCAPAFAADFGVLSRGTNLAHFETVNMAIPSEQATSERVKRAPNKAALEALSGFFRHVLAQHGEAFAQVKQLSMRAHVDPASERGARQNVPSFAHERDEMAAGYAALRGSVQLEQLLESDARPSDLADAMAALDALNPGSPEWGPTFLQVSELVEAQLHETERVIASTDEERRQLATC